MRDLQLIAHDIRSRENVGSLFRTADSLGIRKLWLTGYTPAPPDTKIEKVALGAEKSVVWERVVDIEEVFRRLKGEGCSLYALELTPDARDVADFFPPDHLALLLGTETTGIAPSLVRRCEGCLKITQRGLKESMNVAVAAGIASWAVLHAKSSKLSSC